MSSHEFQPAENVRWIVENRGLLLLHPERGAERCIPYPAAAVWDFVARGYAPERLAGMLRHVGDFASVEEAHAFAAHCCGAWAEEGLLCRGEVAHG